MSVMEAQSCLEMGPSLRSQQVGQEREGRGWAQEGAGTHAGPLCGPQSLREPPESAPASGGAQAITQI